MRKPFKFTVLSDVSCRCGRKLKMNVIMRQPRAERQRKEEVMKEVMIMKQNPLTGDWLCYIPEVPMQAYYYGTKRSAQKFIGKVNEAFERGELEIVDGELRKNV